MNMNDIEILEDYVKTRNLKESTKIIYYTSIKLYTESQGLSLHELLDEAEREEEEGIRWKNRKLKKRLINFRIFLINRKYLKNYIRSTFGRIIAIYTHYEIEIHNLPPINTKNFNEPEPIAFTDLLDKKIIKKALKITTPLMRAIILFQISSGCARRETLELTINDFIKATSEYHNSDNIYGVIQQLKDREDVIPIFKLERKKTGKYYYTFCTPEATVEIINYLNSLEKPLSNEDKVFQIHKVSYTRNFMQLNEQLGLNKTGTYNTMRSHMLRKFHASSLKNDGMSKEDVNSMQGKAQTLTDASYFWDDPKKLRELYIEHMGAVSINFEVNNLDIKSPEYIQLENEIHEKEETINQYEELFKEFDSRLREVEKSQGNVDVDAFDELI